MSKNVADGFGWFPPPNLAEHSSNSSLADIISVKEIQNAAARIGPYIKRTPTLLDNFLSERFGTNVYLKYELLQRTGAFKIRGAFNRMLTLTSEQKSNGVVAVSAGNHAQAVACAAMSLGVKALILMPEDTPSSYLDNTRGYGAEVMLCPTFSAAVAAVPAFEDQGWTFVHPFDDRHVIAGQGTIGLEILQDVPQATDVIVSVGGGGLAGGVAAGIKAVKPNLNIWGVETRGADSMARSLAAGRIVDLPAITSIAKTLGAPRVGELGFELARRYLNGVTVVEDAEAVDEVLYMLESSKILAEPAASCTLAAAERLKDHFTPSSHVVLILCGGNIGVDDLVAYRRSR